MEKNVAVRFIAQFPIRKCNEIKKGACPLFAPQFSNANS